MATLILSAVGSAIGGPLGGTIGALVGRQIDTMIFKPPGREGPRLAELKVTTSSYGMPLPRHFGRMRVAGQIIWSTDLTEHREKQRSGKGSPTVTNYTYTASFAVALGSRPIGAVSRIWADGKLLRGAAGDMKVGGTFRLHSGAGDQAADPLLAAAEGAARCPAYRGLAYAVFEDLQLADFGNRIPNLSFEVIADEAALNLTLLLGGVIEDFDADLPLPGVIGLSGEGALGELLGALDPLFPIDCDGCAEKLTIRPDRLQAAPLALPEAATSTRREDFGGNQGYARKRAAASEQPLQVLRYYDVDRDYQPGAQRASGRPLPGQPRAIDLPAALDAAAARKLVEAAAKRAHWSRQVISWRVTQLDPAIGPGTEVTLAGHPGLWRVSAWEWHDEGIDLSLERLSPHSAGTITADPGRASQAPDLALPVTDLAAFELPWDGNAATAVPLIMAATSSPTAAWTGASLYVDQGDGALQLLGPSGRSRAIIGIADGVLGIASPLLFDRERSVTVTLIGDDLQLFDATMRQLAMGANQALLGSEIIQFAESTPLGNGRWKLTGLWRGRGGTERAVALHSAGERFVLLDGSGTALDSQAIGETPETVIAAIGAGDSAAVTAPIALRGIGNRPLAPVHGALSHLADGSLSLRWTRRARGSWAWLDLVEAPLGEQSEAYLVVYGSDAQTVASWELTQPVLSLSATERSALVAALPLGTFTVRQRGDRGISLPLTITLP